MADAIVIKNRRSRIPPPNGNGKLKHVIPEAARLIRFLMGGCCETFAAVARCGVIIGIPRSGCREKIPPDSTWASSARSPRTLWRRYDRPIALFLHATRQHRGFRLCAL